MIAIDTSIFGYTIDTADLTKGERAAAFIDSLDRTNVRVPWQVLAEFGAVASKITRRLGGEENAKPLIDVIIKRFSIVMPAPAMIGLALDIRQTYRVQYWDALIIASCKLAGVTTLYSEDLPGRVDAIIEGVRVVNPLV